MTTLCGGLDSASFLPSNMTRPYAIIDKNKIETLLPSLVLKVNPVWYDQTTEVGIIWEQSGNDSVYLQAQSLAQVAVLVAHKEAADRVKTVLSTLLCHCHQSGTYRVSGREKVGHIISLHVVSLQIHCAQILCCFLLITVNLWKKCMSFDVKCKCNHRLLNLHDCAQEIGQTSVWAVQFGSCNLFMIYQCN